MDLLKFEPSPWTKNPHIQTVIGEGLQTLTPHKIGQRKTFTLSDGDQISYDIYPGTSDLVVTVGHGLTGSNKAGYIKSISTELNNIGHTVIAYNHRNCGDGFGLSQKTYHSGRSGDLGELIQNLKNHFTDKMHIAIGFSMSGNVLLKLLGDPQYRNQSLFALPDAAIAINPPINLARTSMALGKGVNRIYEFNFIKNLRKYTDRLYHRGLIKKKYEYSQFTTMSEFDKFFTGPESEYGTAENYYRSCSAQQFLPNINRPTYIVTSMDDPFVFHKDFEIARSNLFLHLRLEKYGGHMGYISKNTLPHGTRRWMDYVVLELIKNHSQWTQTTLF